MGRTRRTSLSKARTARPCASSERPARTASSITFADGHVPPSASAPAGTDHDAQLILLVRETSPMKRSERSTTT